MSRVICAGHVNWDVTLHVDRLPSADGEAKITDQRQGGGGSASNVAAVLAQFDLDTTLFGSVGDDEHGMLVEYELDELGVDTDLVVVPDEQTTVKYLIVDADGEVMVLGNEGANEGLRPDDLNEPKVRRADHLHLTSQHPATAERLAEVAVESGVSVSFAPGRRLADRDYGRIADQSDLLFLNEKEATAYCEDPATIARETGRTLVVTHGSGGAQAYTPEGTFHHAGFDVDPVDTTGAGDAFAAGYLAARLDGDVEAALAAANACGAIAAQTMGARTEVDWAALDAYLG
ncbi:PfkB family carbohydrate kinase [Haloarculaceae archaeon H-GB2-1]|nr:PfkB family carbohydrate kinase [Haloarculaceae archaeon H-GB1-1]MEA5387457.1 PfkB family carbohydrate kinase [Haloarculaceae archaeon H-GB11]MEA5408935.1 PfkB family carbohydrate kinase [Haloarculaceae archaeon H-GB2-1]